jgi:hypothetical protein
LRIAPAEVQALDCDQPEPNEKPLLELIDGAAQRGDHAAALNYAMQLLCRRANLLLRKGGVKVSAVMPSDDQSLPEIMAGDILTIDKEISKRQGGVPLELKVARLLLDQVLVLLLDSDAMSSAPGSGEAALSQLLLSAIAMGEISSLSRRLLSGEIERFRDAELGRDERIEADTAARSLGAINANARRSWWYDKAIALFAFYRITTPNASKQSCYYLTAQLLEDQEITEAAVKKAVLRNQSRLQTVEAAVRQMIGGVAEIPKATSDILSLATAALETIA